LRGGRAVSVFTRLRSLWKPRKCYHTQTTLDAYYVLRVSNERVGVDLRTCTDCGQRLVRSD
jgi:hypothetical protein